MMPQIFHLKIINSMQLIILEDKLYKDIKKGIDEMDRVTKPGGKVVFGDEGIAYWLKNTELGKSLITNNILYNLDPPMEMLPKSAKNVNLSWVINNCFYVIILLETRIGMQYRYSSRWT